MYFEGRSLKRSQRKKGMVNKQKYRKKERRGRETGREGRMKEEKRKKKGHGERITEVQI